MAQSNPRQTPRSHPRRFLVRDARLVFLSGCRLIQHTGFVVESSYPSAAVTGARRRVLAVATFQISTPKIRHLQTYQRSDDVQSYRGGRPRPTKRARTMPVLCMALSRLLTVPEPGGFGHL